MKVSVLIPVYNKAPFVQEAVDSILRGTFQDLEVVAVDDRSTDDSLAVLHRIHDPRLRIIELPENRGPAGAANAGIDACRGEYIVRLDADDIAVPDRIERQVALMDAHPGVGASGGHLQLFGHDTEIWRFPLTDDACRAQLLFGPPVSQGASILRRSVLEEHGLRYDPSWPRVGEDWLFWLRMAPCTRFAGLDAPLVHYRRGPQNIARGRDRIADSTFLQEAALEAFHIPYDQRDVDLLVMGLYIFGRTRPDPSNVRDLRRLYDRLLALNEERGFAPKAAFRQRVERQWDRLFYFLPRFGAAGALTHLRLGGRWPLDRLTYLAKYRANALLGRSPRTEP